MFESTDEETCAAGHALRGYKGKCENTHGHNYKVRVVLAGEELDKVGLLYDFVQLKQRMAEVIRSLDHVYLNDIAPFTEINPSAENIAKYFFEKLSKLLPDAPNGSWLDQVTVFETDTTTATYRPSETSRA